MRKKIAVISLLTTVGFALEMPPMPPMMELQNFVTTTKDGNKTVEKVTEKLTPPSVKLDSKKANPKECDLLPPMVVFLPPPMEDILVKCKNKLYLPSNEVVETKLSKLLGKKITVVEVSVVEGFNQLYKVKYDGGVLYCNKSVDKYLTSQIIVK